MHRTHYRELRNRAWVDNTLPQPGLASNIPWSFLLVLNAIFVLLKPPERDVLGGALAGWFDRAFAQSPPEPSAQGLKMLLEASMESWLHAEASAERESIRSSEETP
jgi:hypothetical protein